MNKRGNGILVAMMVFSQLHPVVANASEIKGISNDIKVENQGETTEAVLETDTTKVENQEVSTKNVLYTDTINVEVQEVQVEDLTKAPKTAKQLPKEDFSNDDSKESASAGETEIRLSSDQAMLVETEVEVSDVNANETSEISGEEQFTSEDLQAKLVSEPQIDGFSEDEFSVDEEGKIIAANQTTFTTLGGYDHTSYMYASLEDAINKKNPTPINGGGFEGKYLKTVEQNGEYYAQIEISGFAGYISINDIQIVPNGFEKAATYYANEDGVWTMNVAIDPLMSTEYEKYPMATAPSWAKPGVKYYTYDDQNFSTKTAANSRNARSILSASSYFQNLPFRSTSSYTAADYKKYLTYKGQTSSQYYNYTNGFTDAQKLKGVNSLWIFANANHESAYGTSNYARACDNYFGRGAFDSDPDNACSSGFWWTSPRDSILAQSFFLAQTYGDNGDWVYFGTHPGNKRDGVNAVYASDPLWGAKMGSHMYSTDSYLGGKEEGKYRIYAIDSSQKVYRDSNLSSKLQMQGYGTPNSSTPSDYVLSRNINTGYGQTSYARPRVVVTQDTSKAFKFQLDTPINNGDSRYIGFNTGKNGSYPNFEGNIGTGPGSWYSNYVPNGMVNFASTYGTDWNKQQAWYPKKTSSGSSTYTVLNDVTAKSPSESNTVVAPVDEKPTIKTSTRKASLKLGLMHLEGVGYLRGVSTLNTTDIQHQFIVKDYNSGATVKTYNVGASKRPGELDRYETDGRQYDAGYFATYGYKGVDVSSLSNGKYKIYLGAKSTKNTAYNDAEWLAAGSFNGKSTTMNYLGRRYVLSGSGGRITLTIAPIPDEKPTIKTSTKSTWMKNGLMHIEGIGYLKGVTSKMPSEIQHQLVIKDYNNGTVKQTDNLTAVSRPDLLNHYEGDGRHYDAGYFATKNSQGVNISKLANGKYKLYLSAKSTKNSSFNDAEWLSAGSMSSKSQTMYYEGRKYVLSGSGSRMSLTISNMEDVTGVIKTSARKASIKGTKLHIEGIGYLRGVTTPTTTSIQHRFKFVDYTSGKMVKSYEVGASKRESTMKQYETDGRNYDAGYFATYGYNGVDINNLPIGKYKIFLEANSTKNTKNKSSEWLSAGSLKGKYFTSYANGKKFAMYTENNRLVIEVRKEHEMRTSLAKGDMKGSKVYVEGAAFLNGVTTTDYNTMDYEMKFYDFNNAKLKKTYSLARGKKPSYMNKYETGNLQYDYAYFATLGYNGIDLSNLPDGKYRVNIKGVKQANGNVHGEEWIYASNLKNPITSSANGKTYKIYSVNNRLVIEKH